MPHSSQSRSIFPEAGRVFFPYQLIPFRAWVPARPHDPRLVIAVAPRVGVCESFFFPLRVGWLARCRPGLLRFDGGRVGKTRPTSLVRGPWSGNNSVTGPSN